MLEFYFAGIAWLQKMLGSPARCGQLKTSYTGLLPRDGHVLQRVRREYGVEGEG